MASFSSPEDIDSERSLLLTMQGLQADELREAGITDRAARISPWAGKPLTRACIAVTRSRTPEGLPIELVNVRFVTTLLSTDGVVHEIPHDVPIASSYDGNTAPVPEFSEEDALLVTGLRDAVEIAKEFGALPNIRPDLAGIFNPHTAMATRPPAN